MTNRPRTPLRLLKLIFVNLSLLAALLVATEAVLPRNRKSLPKIAQYHADDDVVTLMGDIDVEFEERAYRKFFPPEGDETAPFRFRVATDRFGCRKNSGGQPPADEKYLQTVALLGDSFTIGMGAEYQNTIQALLEDRLPGTRVLNFGVPASSSYSYGNNLAHFLRVTGAHPDKLVVGVYTDLENGDVPRFLAREKYGELRAFDGQFLPNERFEAVQSSPVQRLIFRGEIWLRTHSSIFNDLFPGPIVGLGTFHHSQSLYGSLSGAMFAELEQKLLGYLGQLRQQSNLPPEKILVWYVPSRAAFAHSFMKEGAAAETRAFFAAGEEFWNLIKASLTREGYPVLDIRTPIEKWARENKTTPFTVDGHLNGAGYGVAADHLIPALGAMDRQSG